MSIDFEQEEGGGLACSSESLPAGLYGFVPESQPEREIFGLNVQKARRAAGLTQREFGDLTGLAQEVLTEIESGMRNISIDTIALIAQTLEQPVYQLLTP